MYYIYSLQYLGFTNCSNGLFLLILRLLSSTVVAIAIICVGGIPVGLARACAC
jgi:hypothetical protein